MKKLWLVLGLMISAASLVIAFRGVHLREVGEALRTAAYLWLIPAVALVVVSLYLRAVRWRILFHPQTDLRLESLFGALTVGYLVNSVFPFRLGEAVRAVWLNRLEPAPIGRGLSTVVVERVLDLLTTIIVLGLLIPFVELPRESVAPLAIGTALAVLAMVVIMVLGANPALAHRLARLVTGFLPPALGERVHLLIDQVLEGFAVLNKPRIALRVVALSFAIFAVLIVALWCCLLAFHLRLSPAAPAWVLALVSVSFVAPSTPGHVGVFEFVASDALRRGFGVPDDVAVSFALVTHAVTFLPPSLLGAWFVARAGISLGRLRQLGARAEDTAHTHQAEAAPAAREESAVTAGDVKP